MAEGVLIPLAEFVAVNAGFSLTSDVAAQLLEGRCLRAQPGSSPDDRPVGKAKEGRKKEAGASPVLVGGAAGASAAQQSRLAQQYPDAARLAADGSASDGSSPRGAADTGAAAESEGGDGEAAPPAEGVDWHRAAAFAGTGVLFCGVAQFVRLRIIDEVFDKNDLSLSTAAAKTGVNQLLFSPLIRAASMATITYHATRDWGDVTRALKEDFFEAQTVSYMVKPASNMAAFVLFPNHILAQAVVMRSVAFGYNVYYSYVTHKRSAGRDADDAADGGAAGSPTAGHIKVELCCDAAPPPRPPRWEARPPPAGARSEAVCGPAVGLPAEGQTGGCSYSYTEVAPASTSSESAGLSGSDADPGAPVHAADLDDLRVIVARRRRRWAEWESKQRRAAKMRRERMQEAEKKRSRGSCRWLSGVASTVGLSWAS